MRFSQYMSGKLGLPDDVEAEYDKTIFKRMVDFVTTLNPEQLSNEQRIKISDIIKDFKLKLKGNDFDNYYDEYKSDFENIYRGNLNRL